MSSNCAEVCRRGSKERERDTAAYLERSRQIRARALLVLVVAPSLSLPPCLAIPPYTSPQQTTQARSLSNHFLSFPSVLRVALGQAGADDCAEQATTTTTTMSTTTSAPALKTGTRMATPGYGPKLTTRSEQQQTPPPSPDINPSARSTSLSQRTPVERRTPQHAPRPSQRQTDTAPLLSTANDNEHDDDDQEVLSQVSSGKSELNFIK